MHEMFFTDRELEVLASFLVTEITRQMMAAMATGSEQAEATTVLQTIAKKVAVEQGF